MSFESSGGCKAIIRPSGIEPKVKARLFAKGSIAEGPMTCSHGSKEWCTAC